MVNYIEDAKLTLKERLKQRKLERIKNKKFGQNKIDSGSRAKPTKKPEPPGDDEDDFEYIDVDQQNE